MTPEDFAKLTPTAQAAVIEKHNDEVRQWRTRCRRCGLPMVGTAKELRAAVTEHEVSCGNALTP